MPRYLLLPLFVLLLAGNAFALTDPTRPTDPALFFASGNATGWTLQSILVSDDRRIAVINGKRVQEGDHIGSARVARIQGSQVIIKTGNRTLKLRLRHATPKTRQ